MKLKGSKTDVKIGDFIVGLSAKGELVIGPVIAISEAGKSVVVGPYQQQSNTALAEKSVHVTDL